MATKGKPAAQKQSEGSLSNLKALFPQREISITNELKVTMRPLPLRALPDFLRPFMQLVQMAEAGATVGDMIDAAGKDVLNMIDLCLVGTSVDDLDLSAAPALVEALVDMNVSGEILGKWAGLLQKIVTMLPNGDERLKEAARKQQQENSKTS